MLPLTDANAWQLQFPCSSFEQLTAYVQQAQQYPQCKGAELAGVNSLFGTVTDSWFYTQLSLKTTKAPDAWDLTGQWQYLNTVAAGRQYTGYRPIVAVIDTGINLDHEDLRDNLLRAQDWLRPEDPMDYDGHGTIIAGIIAAVTNNVFGVAGMCPSARLISKKVLPVNDYGQASAIYDSVDSGADVINISSGGPIRNVVMAAAIDYANRAGVLVVAAAGNDNCATKQYPAGYSASESFFFGQLGPYNAKTISVGDTVGDSRDGAGSAQCRTDAGSNFGAWVDVYAPGLGQGDVATYIGYAKSYSDASSSSTSFAAPFVTGAVALLKGMRPDLSGTQIKAAILNTLDDLGQNDPNGNRVRRLNVLSAAQAIAPPNRPPLAHFTMTSGSLVIADGGAIIVEALPSGKAPIVLNGNTSSDPDGYITSWQWWMESGPALSVAPGFTQNFSVGSHTVTLVVTDNGGRRATAQAVVVVRQAGTVLYSNFGPNMAFEHDGNFLIGGTAGSHFAVAVKFQSPVTVRFSDAKLPLALPTGSGQISVFLMTDAAGLPGSILERIDATANTVPATATVVTLFSASQPLLTAGVPYWLAVVGTTPQTFAWWYANSTADPHVTDIAFNWTASAGGPWNHTAATRPAFQIDGVQ